MENVFFSIVIMGWLVATIHRQFVQRPKSNLIVLDIFYLIPIWTFFSPNPGTKDHSLVYHHHNQQHWKTAIETSRNHWWAFLFNPNKLEKKALQDLSQLYVERANNSCLSKEDLQGSYAYLALLNVVTTKALNDKVQSHSNDSKIQYAIIATNGFLQKKEVQLIGISEWHKSH